MWDIIETDFGGDETANFGPRKETGTALYQIDTIATVSCTDTENKKLPVSVASVCGDLTALAVEKNLVIEASSILKLDSDIEEVEWSPDGSLIVLGLSEGKLIILDASTSEVEFSVNLVPAEKRVNGRSFKRILFSGTGDLVILTADGQLIVKPDIQLFKQEEGSIKDMNMDNVKMVSTKSQHTLVKDIVIMGDYIYTLGDGVSVLCQWSYQHGSFEVEEQVESCLLDDAHLVAGQGTTDGIYLFVLDSNHTVSIWDARMLICLKTLTGVKVSNTSLLERNTSQNNGLKYTYEKCMTNLVLKSMKLEYEKNKTTGEVQVMLER